MQTLTYGKLTVLEEVSELRYGKKRKVFKCLCACGNHATPLVESVKSGNTQSCGCGNARHTKYKHGLVGTPEYQAWAGMVSRTTNPHNVRFARYGGRGIKICEQWRHSPETFYANMGPRPSPKHTIERVNNDGDYAPDNCIWALKSAQNRNHSGNHWVTFKGERLCLMDWALRTGINFGTLRGRLVRGWSVEMALTIPVNRAKFHVNI